MKKSAAVLTIAAALGLTLVAAAGAATSPWQPKAQMEIASLTRSHWIYNKPGGKTEGMVSDKRPITGERTALPVLKTATKNGSEWLLVRLPGAPNGHTGWIQAKNTHLWEDPWHVVVSTGQRRLYVYKDGRLLRDWLVVVGAPSTPTPTGQFFVEENIQEPRSAPGYPYALATSARSTAGQGRIGLHGMGNIAYVPPGTAGSHGCVRMPARKITWLAARVSQGTPVTITN